MRLLHLFGFLDAFQEERAQTVQVLEMVVFRAGGAFQRKAPYGPAGVVHPAKSQKK